MNERLNTLFPVSFGAGAGGFKGLTLGMITGIGIIEVMCYAALGAMVGWCVKLILDYLKAKYDKKMKKQYKKENE
jgi:hypothetical protein